MTLDPHTAPSLGETVDAPAEWLTRAEASAYLETRGIRMKPTTLARAYSTGSGGPPCRHIRNKPYYPQDLLAAWADDQITAPASSSSERQRLRREMRARRRPHV